jgi:YD repeat-containing protein
VSLPAGEYVLHHNRLTIPVIISDAAVAPRPRTPSASLRRPPWLANLVVNPNNANVTFTDGDGPLMRCYNSRSMYDGPLGYGWSFDYSTQLRKTDKGAFEITEPSGFVTSYRQTKSGHHTAIVSTFPSELIEEKDRVVRRVDAKPFLEKFGRPVREEVFSPDGRLISIRHTSGDVHELQYEANVIKAVIDKSSGKTLYAFKPDPTGHIVEMTTPSGQRFTYAYKGKALASVTDAAGAKKSYEYSEHHNLTGITFPDTSTATLEYDEAKDWLRSLVAEGVEHRYEYGEQGAGHVWTTRTDQDANVTRWDFHDTFGALVSSIDNIQPPATELVERATGVR